MNNAQNDWDSYLAALKSAYSNHINAATKHTPFFLAYREHPVSLADLSISDGWAFYIETVVEFVKDITKIKSLAKSSVAKSNKIRSVSYNKNRPNTEFDVGDLVFLSTANLPLRKTLPRKLSLKYTGPFTVAEKSGSGVTFKLYPPTKLGRAHVTFYFSWLKPYQISRQTPEVLETQIPFDLQLKRNPVENVLAKRTCDGANEALAPYADSDQTEDHLTGTSSIQL